MTAEVEKVLRKLQEDSQQWDRNYREVAAEIAADLSEALARDRAAQGEALYGLFRAIVDAGGPTTIARHGVERDSAVWEGKVRAGLLAIERQFHPERFDDDTRPPVAGDAVVERALAYLRPHLDAGTFAAPDWAIQLASILTGGDGCGTPAPPAGDAQVREQMGQRISDYLCGLSENGMVTLDPFDSNSIDAIVSAALTPQPSGEVEG